MDLAHLAEPSGEPDLFHGHVIRENFIVKKELHLAGRWEHCVRNSPFAPSRTHLVPSKLCLPLWPLLLPKKPTVGHSHAGDLASSGDRGPSGDDEPQL